MTGLQIPPKADNSSDGVKVMTYHGSKGLEWRMVILYSTWKDPLYVNGMIPRYIFGMPTLNVDGRTILRYFPDFRPTDRNGVPSFITDRTDVAAEIEGYIEQQREECKRLLYVGMTRAKDYLVTIMYPNKLPKWLRAAGLTPAMDLTGDITSALVWDTEAPLVNVERCNIDDPVQYSYEQEECVWYKPLVDVPAREDRFIIPSKQAVSIDSEKGEMRVIADGIEVTGKYDASELGTCIHNYFAVHQPGAEGNLATAQRLVSNFGLEGNVPQPAQIVDAADRLLRWLEVNVGSIKGIRREVPFTHHLEGGQTVSGEIDLIVEMDGNHCVLLDYKNTQEEGDYAPQLSVYRSALRDAGYIVDGMFIFYALQGAISEITIK